MSIIKLDQDSFRQQIEEEKKVVLAEFWAPWCVYCRRLGPAFDKIAEEYGDRLVIGQINIDDEQQLAVSNQIEVVPTLVLYKDGQAVDSVVAPQSKAAIEEFIKPYV